MVAYVAQQVKVPAEEWAAYDWAGRAIKRHPVEIRGAFGFRECTEEDQTQLAEWLAVELCGWGCRGTGWRRPWWPVAARTS